MHIRLLSQAGGYNVNQISLYRQSSIETKVNNFQNNAKNSSIILTQKSSETETNGSVTIFRNSEFGNIRTIVDPNGDVWFVAVDVARSLGYATPKNPVKRHVDEEDTILLQLSDFQRDSFWAPL